MQEDETQVPQEENTEEVTETTEDEGSPAAPAEGVDYRGKLNATNNFLKKEGYAFNNNTKQWEKPNTPSIPQATAQEGSLSIKDQVFLAKADIHEDDLDEVLDRAKSKGISISEAYNQVKPLLNARSEERKTASATHVRGGARGASKPTGQDLLNKAEQSGDIPETEEGMIALAEARLARKKNK